jgi:hypothetical protein
LEKVCKWIFVAKRQGKQGEKQCGFFRGALVLSPSRRREGILFAIWSGFSSKVENGETNKNLGMSSKASKSARCVRKSQFRLQAADLKGNSQ